MAEFMLCARGNLTRDEVVQHMNSGNYLMQLKFDGIRAMITKKDGLVTIKTRNGMNLSHILTHLTIDIARVPPDITLDGELILPNYTFRELQSAVLGGAHYPGVNFVAFDILQLGEINLTNRMWIYRQKILTEQDMRLAQTQIYRAQGCGAHDAISMYDGSRFHNTDEGFILKHKDSLYTPGYSQSWLRSKFVNSISVVPLDVTDDLMVTCGLRTGVTGQSVHVAKVQVPAEDLVLILEENLNMVIELECYGYDEQTSQLRHPVFKGVRFDVDYDNCSTEQLETLRAY